MPLVWASLALAILLPTTGAVVVFRRVLALWRDLGRSGKALADGLAAVSTRLERMSAAAEGPGEVTARAEPSVARLQVSLARLAVLRAAVSDVRDSVGRVTAVYPRK